MGSKIEYLYGDSTPAPVKSDFIAFLRDGIDFAVDVMRRDGLIADAEQRAQRMSEEVEREIERAEALASQLAPLLDTASVSGLEGDSLAARCAARIRQGAADVVQAEAELARAMVTAERGRTAKAAETSRDAAVRALEKLVVQQELPDAAMTAKLSLPSPQGPYELELHGQTPYGLQFAVSAQIPPSDLLAHTLRVERVMDRLEVDAPEAGGWLHREVKPRPQRLDRLYLAELETGPTGAVLKLRVAPEEASAGFDIALSPAGARVELLRRSEGGQGGDPPYVVEGADADKLRALHDALAERVMALAGHRTALRAASLDGTPLQRVEAPRVLVERLIAHIAPTVERISRASLVPGELVLKKRVDHGHREEVFVSKAELLKKVQTLPPALQEVFDPLALGVIEPTQSLGSQPPGQNNNARSTPPLAQTGKWPSMLPPPDLEADGSQVRVEARPS